MGELHEYQMPEHREARVTVNILEAVHNNSPTITLTYMLLVTAFRSPSCNISGAVLSSSTAPFLVHCHFSPGQLQKPPSCFSYLAFLVVFLVLWVRQEWW